VEWGEGEEDEEGVTWKWGLHRVPGEAAGCQLRQSPRMGVPRPLHEAQGDWGMGAQREGAGVEGVGGLAGWVGERPGGAGESESELASELCRAASQLASEVLALTAPEG